MLAPLLDDNLTRVPPAAFDPDAPHPAESSELMHRIPVFSLAVNDDEARAELEDLDHLGERFAESFDEAGLARRMNVDVELPWGIDEWTEEGPEGSMETIELTFAQTALMVAFRDGSGNLRLAPFDDERDTEDLPLVESSPTGDPALVQTRVRTVSGGERIFAPFLHVLYGTQENVEGAVVPTRLSYRTVRVWDPTDPLDDSHLEPPARIDGIEGTEGLRRKMDYGFIRTLQAPVVASDGDNLHVFVVALDRDNVAIDDLTLGPDDSAGAGNEVDDQRDADRDRIRHAVLRTKEDGKLSAVSERPVYLTRSGLVVGDSYDWTAESDPRNHTQAGVALGLDRRGFVRWFYPTREAFTVRTVRSP